MLVPGCVTRSTYTYLLSSKRASCLSWSCFQRLDFSSPLSPLTFCFAILLTPPIIQRGSLLWHLMVCSGNSSSVRLPVQAWNRSTNSSRGKCLGRMVSQSASINLRPYFSREASVCLRIHLKSRATATATAQFFSIAVNGFCKAAPCHDWNCDRDNFCCSRPCCSGSCGRGLPSSRS